MTTRTAQAPATLSAFLFGLDNAGAGQFLKRVHGLGLAHTSAKVADLSHAAQQIIAVEVSSIAATLCDLDLGEVALAGWGTHVLIYEAVVATRDNREGPRVVDLATHKIISTYRPVIDVLVDGVTVTHIEFQLTLEFALTALAATVRDGRVVSVQPGRCTLSAALAVAGVEVIRRAANLDLSPVVASTVERSIRTDADGLQMAFPWGRVTIPETGLVVGRAPNLSPLAGHLAAYDGVSCRRSRNSPGLRSRNSPGLGRV